MRDTILLMAALAATTGCKSIASKLGGDAGATPATTADGSTASGAKAALNAGSAALPAAPLPSASAAPTLSASAGPTLSASAAPNVDAKGRPCKQWEASVNGVCETICYSNKQCKHGFVCNGELPGRTDKAKYCGNPVCKPGEKRLRENHYTLKCLVPCKSDADCKGGTKCGSESYFNEEADNALTRACE